MKRPPLSGRYELEEIVGTGGMAVVYRAWDLKLDREVAVKVLRPEYLTDQARSSQFNHEAQATSKMSHPNIVGMYDVGQDGDTRYIVMEYVRGVTLESLIRQNGTIRPQRAVQITLKILQALGHAHKNNIVHRDIKPQNILVDADGRVKVTDFGIARMVGTSTATLNGQNILGSVHYFSPEQAQGKVAGPQSDLYSVGVVLYEMVTGRVPFDGDTPMTIALKHVGEEPVPPSQLSDEVSKGLEEVILKALSKDPEKRYRTAFEMAVDLKRAMKMPMGGFISKSPDELQKSAQEERRLRRRAMGWALAAVVAFALCLCAWRGWMIYERLKTRVRVPSLVLTGLEDAQARLDDLGVAADVTEVHSDEVIAGMVVRQSPEAGSLIYPGETVSLEVSLGREAVTVPPVTGLTRSEAVQAMDGVGLPVAQVILEISDEVPVGQVIRQSPEADAEVAPFTEVTLYVSGECSVVPPLLGLTVDLARATLAASGLQLGGVIQAESNEAPGTVVEQSVEAGARVLWGEDVDITISRTDDALYFKEVTLPLTVKENGTTVRAVMTDGETEREIFRTVLNAGEQTVTLTADSNKAGEQIIRLYAGDALASETKVTFGEN